MDAQESAKAEGTCIEILKAEAEARKKELNQKIGKSINLLERALDDLKKKMGGGTYTFNQLIVALRAIEELYDEETPDRTWFREVFELTGEKMILCDYGWEPLENLYTYVEEDPKFQVEDSINCTPEDLEKARTRPDPATITVDRVLEPQNYLKEKPDDPSQ